MADFPDFNQQAIPGQVAVAMEITDESFHDYRLPGWVFERAAIPGEHVHQLGVMR